MRYVLGVCVLSAWLTAACGDDDANVTDANMTDASVDAGNPERDARVDAQAMRDATTDAPAQSDARVADAMLDLDAQVETDAALMLDAAFGMDASAQDASLTDGAHDGGEAASTSVLVGPSGATVALANGARVVIPAGALASSTLIRLTRLDASDLAPLPMGDEAAGDPFAFEPHGTTFLTPVTITLPFDAGATDVGLVKLAHQDDTSWEALSTAVVNDNAHTITLSTTSFSIHMPRQSGVITLPGDGGASTADWDQEAYVKSPMPVMYASLGRALAVSGNTVVVGSDSETGPPTSPQSGVAFVHVNDGDQWQLQAQLSASNADPGDSFGASVAIDGDTIVVGAPNERSGATTVNGDQEDDAWSTTGAAYVFVRSGSTWTQQAYLKSSRRGYGFGVSVAIDGDTIIVGGWASITGYQGSATIFTRNGTTWSEQAVLLSSHGSPTYSDAFGCSVDVSGDQVVVGAMRETFDADPDSDGVPWGSAYVFARTGVTWSETAHLISHNREPGDSYGQVVAIEGNTIAVGAPWESSAASGINGNGADNSLVQPGAVYVFTRSGNTWAQQAYVKPRYPKRQGHFGSSIALVGDMLVVGSPGDRSTSNVIDSGEDNASAAFVGAAFVFEGSGSTWTQRAFLKAHNAQGADFFGDGVAATPSRVVVGARGESSNATGIDGDGSNNSLDSSGAAYIFRAVP